MDTKFTIQVGGPGHGHVHFGSFDDAQAAADAARGLPAEVQSMGVEVVPLYSLEEDPWAPYRAGGV